MLIVGGVSIVRSRTVSVGAVLLAAAYAIFAIFWAPRIVYGFAYLGWRGMIGALGGIGQEAIVIAAVAILYAQRVTRGARWAFGLSTIAFGVAHLSNIADIGRMVPRFVPLGGHVWAVITGIAFILAGIAILSGILDVVAARLLTLMLAVFSALALVPNLVEFLHYESAWGANVYNLTAIGAAWLLADYLSVTRVLTSRFVRQ
ncbi:MAG TPA: hypothetical protein VKR05_05310 [Candidatus Cybelea sp.]|nr:hypothetical protein [Candidatus Cybelea sp.]